jgi:hypothetical protein
LENEPGEHSSQVVSEELDTPAFSKRSDEFCSFFLFATELRCKMPFSQVRRSHVRPTRVADRSRLTLNAETGSCSCNASELVRQRCIHTHSSGHHYQPKKDFSSSEAEVLQTRQTRQLFCKQIKPSPLALEYTPDLQGEQVEAPVAVAMMFYGVFFEG